MLKRIVVVITMILAIGATDVYSQGFLNNLKKQGKKIVKEKAERVLNGKSSSSSSSAKSSSKSKKSSSKKVTNDPEPFPELVMPPTDGTALFEPLGSPTSYGTLSTPVTTPGTSESAQNKWANSQPDLRSLTNKRLMEELAMFETWVKNKKGQTDAFAVRYMEARDELGERVGSINAFVEALNASHKEDEVDWKTQQAIKDLAADISTMVYRYTIKSSLTPLKARLSEEAIAYFESHGGLDKATTGTMTQWHPFGKPVILSTSIDGVMGELMIDGSIVVQGTSYLLNVSDMTAKITQTNAEEVKRHPDYVIPDHVTGYSGRSFAVVEIRPGAYYGNAMKTLTLPNTLVKIGNNAFANLPYVTRIDIPDGVTELEAACFHNSPELLEVHVPESVTKIGGGCWADCRKLTTVTLPKNVTHFDIGQFQECPSLVYVNLPENLTEIRSSMFEGCTSLKKIVIPNGVRKIGDYVFSGCKSLTSVTFPESLTEIGEGAFSGCASLPSVNLPSNLTTINESAFSGCAKITSITIPQSVTKLGHSVFDGCNALKSVTLSSAFKGQTDIYYAFAYSGVLKRDTLIDYSYFHFVD